MSIGLGALRNSRSKVSIPWLSERNEVYQHRRYAVWPLLILLSLAGESVKALKAASNSFNLEGSIA
jgi:hypothetical protein